MATKWMRWNETTHIFEYSTNDGATYVPLPLNASILNEGTVSPGVLPPSGIIGPASSTDGAFARWSGATGKLLKDTAAVTCDDAGNILIGGALDITGGSATVYASAPIEIRTVNTPRISFHWPGVVASQIGMDNAGVIRTYDNPGTGYAAFACAGITCTALTASGATSLGNTVINGNMQTTGYVYPGRYDTPGAAQGSWILAGHGSYGLYCNTGFYVVGQIWCSGMVNSGAISCTNIVPSALIYANGIGSAAANVTITLATDGYLRRSASSERFKKDIRRGWTNSQRAALLGISPILYTAKEDTENKFGDILGFSAEELDAAGLRLLVNYDEDGKTPFSIREHAFLASFLDLLKDHEQRIVALEGR